MADEAKDVSEGEAPNYLQVAEARKGNEGSPQPGSTPPAPQAPASGAPQAPQPASSQSEVPTFKTLEEAQAHSVNLQKQLNDSQSHIGTQGKEMGELREAVARLQGQVEVVTKPVGEDDADKPYTERFKTMDSLKNLSDDNKQYLGVMFDALKTDLKKSIGGGGGELVTKLNERIIQLENQNIRHNWEREADLLKTQHPELYPKYSAAVEADMSAQIKAGQIPNVTETFKRLSYDDALKGGQQAPQPDAKTALNQEASLAPNSNNQPQQPALLNTKGMSKKDIFKAMVADRKAKGLPL